jgi:hypothetical protein
MILTLNDSLWSGELILLSITTIIVFELYMLLITCGYLYIYGLTSIVLLISVS